MGQDVPLGGAASGVGAKKGTRGDGHANVPPEAAREKAAMQHPESAGPLNEGQPTAGDSSPDVGPGGSGRTIPGRGKNICAVRLANGRARRPPLIGGMTGGEALLHREAGRTREPQV